MRLMYGNEYVHQFDSNSVGHDKPASIPMTIITFQLFTIVARLGGICPISVGLPCPPCPLLSVHDYILGNTNTNHVFLNMLVPHLLREPSQSHLLREPSQSHLLREPSQSHLLREPSQSHLLREPSQSHLLREPSQSHPVLTHQFGHAALAVTSGTDSSVWPCSPRSHIRY